MSHNAGFSLFEVIILIGIAQGIIISAMITLRKRQQLNKLLLLAVLITFNLLGVKILIHTTGLWDSVYFRYFPLAFELLIQPLVWLYIHSLVYVPFKLNRKHWPHFVPFAISMGYALTVYMATLSTMDLNEKDAIANGLSFNLVKQIEEVLAIFSAIIYWWMGARLVHQYRQWLFDYTSTTDYPTYNWLRRLSLLCFILIGIWGLTFLLENFSIFQIRPFVYLQVFFIYLSSLVYYLGFRGYMIADNTVILAKLSQQQLLSFLPAQRSGPVSPVSNDQSSKQNLLKEQIEKVLIEQKLYLDPELTIQKLADVLGSSSSVVSKVINQSFGKSFRTLVNEYRVEAVKRMLDTPQSQNLSLLGIAFECGFNSEASFYRIFKSIAGISPKTYVQQNKHFKQE
ncbi:AraC family transcriptional regulator [Siphonobacter sp. SORGH_AS_0500]|uniref:helix-turn-helix domain-containing protein n=1 Tax=Siphonobacter sp. SORGH_AS_0500 TaxID=1864824 RepID=UPI00285E7125|nr:AraC family transcriptional regulator [Siphonobacter sp. SORGH_AS_0500]MDR6194944.1 AraC-like DNA-binding protein [Siphonobacter sp. SORGH_AS_0500]